ncbi:ABC transporter ATP-binding protein [Bacillus sp. AGMB 02131]|uniref:ABC transporter ATP-binding protein n=1 Tax=Peribacillus faecalis TaxID=2772559 RepID=A0A927D0C8_9BACI|nr:ABC transporter ATP-binding protein [Peribacillus faecalis]MBD3108704.1 ABC transporter ATP-binding protein [Peribacillus faecalis]
MTVTVQVKEKAFLHENSKKVVLDDIDLKIEKGDFLTIIGPSGCGKSTLLKIIAGLDTEFNGTVLINEKPVVKPGITQGFIFQEHRLFPWMTVEQNIAADLNLKDAEVRRKVDEMIEIVRLKGYEKAYPSEISGGMSQRVAIARALIREPEVLLLDEPFGALDAFTRQHLQDVLIDIWQKKKITMVLVTHDIDESIYLGTEIAILRANPGKVQKWMRVPLSYPRNRTNPSFQEVRQRVLLEFEKTEITSYTDGAGI